MKALILAGGKGTRLRPLTVFTPKPIVPLVNRPFLLYQIDLLAKAGITDITLSLSYQPNKIEDLLDDGSEFGVQLRYVTEPHPMGTGGAYKYALTNEADPVIVFNGDILTDMDISTMVDVHKSSNSEATIALTPVDDPSKYGLIETDTECNVLRFLEKPSAELIGSVGTNLINAGVYILEPSILELIPAGENYSFEYNVFPTILENTMRFRSYSLEGSYWRDIGNPESYLAAHLDLLDGKVKQVITPDKVQVETATSSAIDELSVLGEGCVVKPHARVINSVLGPGVHVEEKAVIENSIIWGHTRISSGSDIKESIICRSCHIGRHVSISPGSVIGDRATLPDYSKV